MTFSNNHITRYNYYLINKNLFCKLYEILDKNKFPKLNYLIRKFHSNRNIHISNCVYLNSKINYIFTIFNLSKHFIIEETTKENQFDIDLKFLSKYELDRIWLERQICFYNHTKKQVFNLLQTFCSQKRR